MKLMTFEAAGLRQTAENFLIDRQTQFDWGTFVTFSAGMVHFHTLHFVKPNKP